MTYTDANGVARNIKFHSVVPFLVDFGDGMSTARRWILEDGSVVMIPDEAWKLINVDIEKEMENDPATREKKRHTQSKTIPT